MLSNRKNKMNLYLALIFGLVLFVGVGYAMLTSNLNIFGTTTINKASWDVHFENLRITDGSVTATTPATIDTNSTTVNFGVTLTNPGDYYEFTVDEVNKGTIDAMVSSLIKTGLTEEQAKYLDYTVSYSDGVEVAEKQLLPAGDKETVKVRVEFKRDITVSDLPTTSQTLNLSFSINYVQADSSAVAVVPPICRRATILHNDGTTTYGSLGTKGTLVSGDAFDCDVNGDGVYDSEVERFYYVSDLDENNNYAVLIYYNNVAKGLPNNTRNFAYALTSSTAEAGPVVSVLQLPTRLQWSKVDLFNKVRTISDESKNQYTTFDYSGYSARFLTYHEIQNMCYDRIRPITSTGSLLAKCKYLLENTMYSNSQISHGYWIETIKDSSTAWRVSGYNRSLDIYDVKNSSYFGVRPVVEIEKYKIKY